MSKLLEKLLKYPLKTNQQIDSTYTINISSKPGVIPVANNEKNQSESIKQTTLTPPAPATVAAQKVSTSSVEEAPKRKRGRPRKIARPDGTPTSPTASPTKNEEIQREEILMESLEDTDSDTENKKILSPQTEPIKRGRGRPRKYPLKTESEPSSTDIATTPKKRGRPRKYPLPTEGDTPEKDRATIPEETQKKKRGRPRKYPLPDSNADTVVTNVASNINTIKPSFPSSSSSVVVPTSSAGSNVPNVTTTTTTSKTTTSAAVDMTVPLKKRGLLRVFETNNRNEEQK